MHTLKLRKGRDSLSVEVSGLPDVAAAGGHAARTMPGWEVLSVEPPDPEPETKPVAGPALPSEPQAPAHE